jgi:hypothetical protein
MDFEGLQNLYAKTLGWVDIDNGATRLTLKGQTLDFVGVGDAHYGEDALAQLPGIVDDLRESGQDRSSAQSSITTIGVTSLIMSLLATLYPSWRASRLQPAEVLRHD